MSDYIRTHLQPLSWTGGGTRGLQLQCPWSNCFPQLYGGSKKPCALTPFADFRELTDHIWKYHSFILCCVHCDTRFASANRAKKARPTLDKLKNDHMMKNHLNNVS
jgi:hypothetical protein